tara:strand:- start:1205 stop:1636 length:432 start_codon:yes stop_codon:yes gene_type:complete
MPSKLDVDEIAAKNGTGPVTLTKQSAAKAFVNFNGTGTIVARKSLNLSSLTDSATGTYNVNFSSSMDSVNYVATCSGKASQSHARGGAHIGAYQSGNNFGTDTDGSYTASYFNIGTTAASSSSESGSLQDIDAVDLVIHGDLA